MKKCLRCIYLASLFALYPPVARAGPQTPEIQKLFEDAHSQCQILHAVAQPSSYLAHLCAAYFAVMHVGDSELYAWDMEKDVYKTRAREGYVVTLQHRFAVKIVKMLFQTDDPNREKILQMLGKLPETFENTFPYIVQDKFVWVDEKFIDQIQTSAGVSLAKMVIEAAIDPEAGHFRLPAKIQKKTPTASDICESPHTNYLQRLCGVYHSLQNMGYGWKRSQTVKSKRVDLMNPGTALPQLRLAIRMTQLLLNPEDPQRAKILGILGEVPNNQKSTAYPWIKCDGIDYFDFAIDYLVQRRMLGIAYLEKEIRSIQ